MTQLNLRLPEELRKMAERYAKLHGYKNIQELAKESIRVRIHSSPITKVKSMPRVLKEAIPGTELIRKLSPEARKGLEEISRLPKSEWKKWYKEIKKKEKARAKSLMQAY